MGETVAGSSASGSELFAAKGRAIPAGSERLSARAARNGNGAAPPKPDAAPETSEDKSQEDGPASVLSIDLRSVLVPVAAKLAKTPPAARARAEAPTAPGTPDPVTPSAAPPLPRGNGMAGPFIAAVIAISVAGGVFYVFETDRFGATPIAEIPAAVETAADDAGSAADPDAEPQGDVPAAEVATQSTEDEAEESGSLPSFDLVQVSPDGSAVIAGRAAPYAELILLHNGEPIGKVTADWAGEWAFVTNEPLETDRHQITILVNDPDAEITLPEGAEPPAQVTGTSSLPER